jgi:hypothetical protein
MVFKLLTPKREKLIWVYSKYYLRRPVTVRPFDGLTAVQKSTFTHENMIFLQIIVVVEAEVRNVRKLKEFNIQ